MSRSRSARRAILFLLCLCLQLQADGPLFEKIEEVINYPLLNPSLSTRKVEKLKLPNGMLAYVISDPDVKQSAAGVCVQAGSWHDPKEYPGMAHFLEHMLFMGTKAYPTEFEYMQYIFDHGGKVNASTWPDRTIYMFSINNEAYGSALDRFAHFFIDPLLLTSCIDRELHAVDQEHAKNVEHDGWRQYMVFKETGNPLHPNAAFSTGNAKTLGGIPQEALKKWYESHYSADRMHLILLSPLPLDELKAQIAATFAQVPKRKVEERNLPEMLTSPQQRGRMIFLKPVKDLRTLSLTWEVSSIFGEWERRPTALVARVLNNETENSLLAELKREKLAESISVSAERPAKGKVLFTIDVDLTPLGTQQTDNVIARVFQALALLKEQGIPRYIFDELHTMSALKYQYQSREDAFDFISSHAHDILEEEIETYPEKMNIPTVYDPKFTHAFLRTLTPENCVYFMTTDPEKISITTDRKEKWMGAEYTIREIPEQKLTAWGKLAPHPQIALPSPNPYLPDLATFTSVTEKDESPVIPTLLADDRYGKVYHALDKRYLVPELYSSIALKTPLIDGSAKALALADLYTWALTEKLSETIWFAETAGLHPQFRVNDLKFVVNLYGYHSKAALFLKEIFHSLKAVQPTREQFEIYKHSLMTRYENGSKELPVRQAQELLQSILYSDEPTHVEKVQALKGVSFEEFITFSKALFKSAYAEGLVYGNLPPRNVKLLWDDLKNSLGYTPLPLSDQRKKQILLLPETRGPHLIKQSTPRQGNGVLLLLQQGASTFEKKAGQDILARVLQEAFFDTLRTKQQTAYIAKAWAFEDEKQLLQFFAVQSSTHHPSELIARFELFLEDFLKKLPETLSVERFEELRRMQIETYKMPPENLPSLGRRLTQLAFDFEADFVRDDELVEAATQLTHERLLSLAKQFLARGNLRRLAILMEGVLPRENDFRYEHTSKEEICDLGIYSSSN